MPRRPPEAVQKTAMRTLHESQLENVCDTAYALDPVFTPNYSVTLIEHSAKAGYQLRVVTTLVAMGDVHYLATDEDVDAETKKTLRVLMQGMYKQAADWLEANPEVDA